MKARFIKVLKRLVLISVGAIIAQVYFDAYASYLNYVSRNNDNEIVREAIPTTPKKNRELNKTNSYDYLDPVYGEYETSDNSSMSNEDVPDQYESNNSFSKSTLLSSNPSGRPFDYNFSINATLHINPWWYLFWRNIDEDYYRFDVFANANVSVGLRNIAVGLDYNLELYMHRNIKYPGSDSVVRVSSSTKNGNENEYITATLSPGTYYARVYSSNGYSASSEYTFYGSVDYINDLSNGGNGSISIPSLRYNMGAGAAIWISDLDPYGIKPLKTYAKEEVGYRYYDTSNSMFPTTMLANENPFYYEMPANQRIAHSILYVWDLQIRSELYSSLARWEAELLSQISSNEELRIKLELTELIVDGVNTIVGVSLSLITLNPIVSLSVAVGQAGISPVTAILLRSIWPEAWDTSRDYMVNHIRILKAALECNIDTSPNEVVRIPITYCKVTESPFMFNAYMNINYIDFTPQYSQSGYLYNESTISNYQNDGFTGGKVYGIKTYSDFNAAYNRISTTLEEINTGGNVELALDVAQLDGINKGEYKWYNFTAPSIGEYTFFTEGETDTYGELFNEIVPAVSVNGRMQFDDNSGINMNFSIKRVMNYNQQIYIRVRGYSDSVTGIYSLKVLCTGAYSITSRTITPSDYKFDGIYNFVSEAKHINLSNEFNFQTNRLRCGYIGEQYLTLSAKRKNAGLAYLEFNFEQNLFSVDFNISLWSDSEALNSAESSIKFQYIDYRNVWKDAIVFNASTLSKSKDIQQQFSYNFSTPVHGFRFYVTTNAVNNENNKGRVVIGDVVVNY